MSLFPLVLSFLQGVGGTVQFPLGYLKKAFERVRAYGGVCVADEVSGYFLMGQKISSYN